MLRSSKLVQYLAIALCCVLFLFFAVEGAHIHKAGAGDLQHCPLCGASQLALQVVSSVGCAILLLTWASACAPRQRRKLQLTLLTAYIRPPPQSSSVFA